MIGSSIDVDLSLFYTIHNILYSSDTPDKISKGLRLKYFITVIVLIVIPFIFVSAESSYLTGILPHITLEGNDGSFANGDRWDSLMLQGKITMLVYFDPDERAKGEIFMPTLEAFERDLDFSQFQILLIVNLKATWIPGLLIKAAINNQATAHPSRNYIFDNNSVLVNSWGLDDNEYNTLIIDEESRVIYSHSGKWNEGEILLMDLLLRSQVEGY